MAEWYTASSVKNVDKNLAQVPESVLAQIIETARNQVVSLPPLPRVLAPGEVLVPLGPGEIDDHWALGHLMQIQALAKANKVGPGDTIGPEGFTVRVYPMDFTVMNVLRPRTTSPRTMVG